MKRRLLAGTLMAFAVMLLCNMKTNAQITGVDIVSVADSTNGGCTLPATVGMNFYGNVTGTPGTNDSIDIYLNFGDGTDTSFKAPIAQLTYFYGFIEHTYFVAGTFAPTYTASFGSFSDVETANPPIIISNSCAPLTGTVYMDANSNCVKDAGESAVPYEAILITNTTTLTSYYAYTDANGDYSYGVPAGYTYTVTPAPFTAVTVTCPSSGSATVAVSAGSTYTNDFGLECNSATATDASIYGYAWNWRPGFNRPLYIYANTNSWCLTVPATITLTLDPLLTYTGVSGGVAPTTVSGSTVTWNIATLGSLMSFYSGLDIYCDPSATLGDSLCVNMTISTTPTDANPANNSYTVCAPINNSMDPNQKSVAPKGEQAEGYIPNGTELTYIVDFQNTGNDVAYNVIIKDEIDSDLDISTLKVLKSSHSMQPSILPGNVMAFQFSGINLPDSGANEPASHGYVVYSIQPKANLANGTQIQNTANIYFDSNPAIVTNTTMNTIGLPTGIQHISNGTLKAAIFPNPANGNVYIEVDGQSNFKADLYDMLGRNVISATGKDGRSTMNVQSLTSGMYMMKLTGADNKVLTTKINVAH